MSEAAIGGIIVLDKPAGITSARAVDRVKRLLPRGTKIGHAGTLDPFATGVLLLLVGKATRLCEALMGQRKGYEALLKLGARTASDDPETEEQPIEVGHIPSRDEVEVAAARFVGPIQQRPPTFSALKIQGKRACDLTRAGQTLQLNPRLVHVYGIQVQQYDWPMLRMAVECGRGTYVRALARDLGEALGTGAHLRELKRTFIGRYRIQDSVDLDTLMRQGAAPFLRAPEA